MIIPDNKNREQSGFTIIELMIATTIFSFILMICLSGIMQITKMYYRAVTQNKTREVARSIADEIGESIRFTNQSINLGTTIIGPQINDLSAQDTGYFCIGEKRYSYAIDRQVKKAPDVNKKQKKHALWVDSGCVGGATVPADLTVDLPTADGEDLVPENMRLYNLSLTPVNDLSGIYKISVGVAYGDDDLLNPKPDDSPIELSCEGSFAGTEFCATTNFFVTVKKRL